GQERTIARHAYDVSDRRRMHRCPVEPGENASERAGEIRHGVSHHGKTGIGEARGIAVGIENDGRALRFEPREHALEDGLAADMDGGLLAAAPAPPPTPRERQAEE